MYLHFYASAGHAQQSLLCFHYVQLSGCLLPTLAFLFLRTDTEFRIWWNLQEVNHYQEQMNWLDIGWNWT